MASADAGRAAVGELAGAVRGPVLVPGDGQAYDEEVAGYNVAGTHHPRVVVGATSASDVAAAVRWAGRHGLPVGVQATGHGAFTPIEDALLLTTRRMTEQHVDPVAGTVRVGAGVRWSDVLPTAAEHGLATLSGSSSGAGAIGYALGGGLPVLGRTYGFAADHVRSLEVVTADGAIRQVDAAQEPDLFWALRGGQGNFGVVTAMVVDLVRLTRLYGGAVYYPGEHVSDLLHAFRDWAPTLPEQSSTSIALLRLPPLPVVPEPLRGRFTVALRFAHVGDQTEGERLIAPMRAVAPAIIDHVQDMPYTAIDTIHADPHDPIPFGERGMCLRALTDDVLAALLAEAGRGVEAPFLMVEVRLLGGALSRQPEPANAVSGRDGAFSLLTVGLLVPEAAAALRAAEDTLLAALSGARAPASVLNLTGPVSDDGHAWDEPTYRQLCLVKDEVDPQNLFRFGHALRPSAPPPEPALV